MFIIFEILFGSIVTLIGLYTIIKNETIFVLGYDFDKDDSKDIHIYNKSKITRFWGILFILYGASNFINLFTNYYPNPMLDLMSSILLIGVVLIGVFFSINKNIFKK